MFLAGFAGLWLGAQWGLTARPETPVTTVTSAMLAFTLLLETLMLIEPPPGDLLALAIGVSLLVGGVCYLVALVRLLRARFTGAPVPWPSLTKLYLIATAGCVGGTLLWLPTPDSEIVVVLIPLFVLPACLQFVLVRRHAQQGS